MEYIVADGVCAIEYANIARNARPLGHCMIECGRCFNPNSSLNPEICVEIKDNEIKTDRGFTCPAGNTPEPFPDDLREPKL